MISFYFLVLGTCTNTLLAFLGYEKAVTKRNACDKNRHRRSKLWTLANKTIKKLVGKGVSVKHILIGDALYENATAMIVSNSS